MQANTSKSSDFLSPASSLLYKMNYLCKGTVMDLLILMLLLICFAEALEDNPSHSLSTRRKRQSCPNVKLICPTQKQYFVVPSYRSSRRSKSCQLQASEILKAVLTVCDNGVMDQCKDKWINKTNNCTVPIKILKKIIDRAFHHACTLHDLCYLTVGTTQEDCDDWFYYNLKQACKLKSWLKRAGCYATALVMYNAVKLFGGRYHSKGQEWAKENCTSEDPSKDPEVPSELPSEDPSKVPELPSEDPSKVPELPSEDPSKVPELPSEDPSKVPELPSEDPSKDPGSANGSGGSGSGSGVGEVVSKLPMDIAQ